LGFFETQTERHRVSVCNNIRALNMRRSPGARIGCTDRATKMRGGVQGGFPHPLRRSTGIGRENTRAMTRCVAWRPLPTLPCPILVRPRAAADRVIITLSRASDPKSDAFSMCNAVNGLDTTTAGVGSRVPNQRSAQTAICTNKSRVLMRIR